MKHSVPGQAEDSLVEEVDEDAVDAAPAPPPFVAPKEIDRIHENDEEELEVGRVSWKANVLSPEKMPVGTTVNRQVYLFLPASAIVAY